MTTPTILTAPPPLEPGQQLETKALSLFDQANAMKISDQPSYDQAVEFLKGVKALRNEAEIHHRPVIDAAHKAHKAACEALKRIDAPLEQAERTVKQSISTWSTEQERRRRAEEDRLRLEAQRQAEAEAELQIEQAEAEGATEAEVLAMIEQAAMAPAPPPPTVAPSYKAAAGVAVRKTWVAEVTSVRSLILFIAQKSEYEYLLKVDEGKLNQLARMQGAALRIPGVRVVEKQTVAAR
jgi:hypothetical protein